MKSYRTSIVAAAFARGLVQQLAVSNGSLLMLHTERSYGCNQYSVRGSLQVCPASILVVVSGYIERQCEHRNSRRRVFTHETRVVLSRDERRLLDTATALSDRVLRLVERRVAHLFELAREAACDPIHGMRESVYQQWRLRKPAPETVPNVREQVFERMEPADCRFWQQWLTSQPLAL